jgi:hypothetical protein
VKKIIFLFVTLYILLNVISASATFFPPGEVVMNVHAYCSDSEYSVASVEVKCEKQYPYQEHSTSVSKSQKTSSSNKEGWHLRCEGGHATGTIVLTCCKDDCVCETIFREAKSWENYGEPVPIMVVSKSKEFKVPELVFPNAGAEIGDVINIELFDNVSYDCTIYDVGFNDVLGTYGVACKFEDILPSYALFSTNSEGGMGISIFIYTKSSEKYSVGYDPDSGKMILKELIKLNKKNKHFECVFENSYSIKKCQPEGFGLGCLGIDKCLTSINYWDVNYPEVDVISQIGKEVEWVSPCGTVSMVLGVDMPEKIVFDCKEEVNPDKIINCDTGHYPKYLDGTSTCKEFVNNFFRWLKNLFTFR